MHDYREYREYIKSEVQLPVTEITMGEFGVIENRTTLIQKWSSRTEAIAREIKRYPCGAVLTDDMKPLPEVDIQIISSLDNTIEEICLKAIIPYGGRVWAPTFLFSYHTNDGKAPADYYSYHKHYNKYNHYFFNSFIGCGGPGPIPVNAEFYANVRIKAIEMCNPHNPYDINAIIELLRGLEHPKIDEMLHDDWDRINGTEQPQSPMTIEHSK
ncbi:MAG: hypothetical protein FWE28_01285 [Oscillospiraceae bacterium]|nr:hypothetical protein [Oscillospiraceae bacterium]